MRLLKGMNSSDYSAGIGHLGDLLPENLEEAKIVCGLYSGFYFSKTRYTQSGFSDTLLIAKYFAEAFKSKNEKEFKNYVSKALNLKIKYNDDFSCGGLLEFISGL